MPWRLHACPQLVRIPCHWLICANQHNVFADLLQLCFCCAYRKLCVHFLHLLGLQQLNSVSSRQLPDLISVKKLPIKQPGSTMPYLCTTLAGSYLALTQKHCADLDRKQLFVVSQICWRLHAAFWLQYVSTLQMHHSFPIYMLFAHMSLTGRRTRNKGKCNSSRVQAQLQQQLQQDQPRLSRSNP